MEALFNRELAKAVAQAGVVAVVVIDRAEDGPPLARALAEGGVCAIELTLRTPAALEALRAIRAEAPGVLAGVGTILTPAQALAAREAGAAFGVAPGCNPRVMAAAREAGLSFAPGVATPTDIEVAIEHGCELMKFFPAEHLGGLPYLRNIAAPYQHLGLRYIPLGGLTAANAASYLADPLIAAVGGSWLAPRDAITARNWDAIRAAATGASALKPRTA